VSMEDWARSRHLSRVEKKRRNQVSADPDRLRVHCEGRLVNDHERCWARHQTLRDIVHLDAVKAMRRERLSVVSPGQTLVEQQTPGDFATVFDLGRGSAVMANWTTRSSWPPTCNAGSRPDSPTKGRAASAPPGSQPESPGREDVVLPRPAQHRQDPSRDWARHWPVPGLSPHPARYRIGVSRPVSTIRPLGSLRRRKGRRRHGRSARAPRRSRRFEPRPAALTQRRRPRLRPPGHHRTTTPPWGKFSCRQGPVSTAVDRRRRPRRMHVPFNMRKPSARS